MFVRIVKMGFHEEHVGLFLDNFKKVKLDIRNFPGNRFLELYRDKADPTLFFTYSYWETEADLETYRKSALFCDTWAVTKPLFKQKAEAWSVDKLVSLP
ncbi:putative quinol monooxygenase [Flavobacterium subsaxonicum]|uniref:Antibiotic biosynthesis monooxygenase n=1 Tax=Flavobacterium subsaxonicum WB 4.1-42 = DSM 21790 TaxID=1121898 RepID=A0A0A2MKF1_9FLAO|nr:antibiotic biosynthesis monooxygenase family protein [Flavobacterium subsaxonicum]KGO91968.1 antibiotic biosynthesis monooxygenase [Flavobacterium subsaxonicum WB 4.1-42 = DSM 21790]